MKAIARMFFLYGSVLVISGCTAFSRPPVVNEPAPIPNFNQNKQAVSKIMALGVVDQVVITGSPQVVINGHQLQNNLLVQASSDAISAFSANTRHGILYITYQSNPFIFNGNPPLYIEVNLTNDIHVLTVKNNTKLMTKNIGDTGLTLNLSGESTTSMTGNHLLLTNINAKGHALLHAYWLNSPQLQLTTEDSAKIFLGGKVGHIDINAMDNSVIDTSYLNVNNGIIKASDNASVGINIKHTMTTWASNSANIYYYRNPDFGAYYLDDKASTLPMVGLSRN